MLSIKVFRSLQAIFQHLLHVRLPQQILPHMPQPCCQLTVALLFASGTSLCGCVMSEEVKRIEANKKAQMERLESGSTNLTGEQIFIRTCNTCHPGGAAGMGPTLENMAKDFPSDDKLKAFLRKGKGMMPPQPKEVLNDQEMDNLVGYLRSMTVSK
jgi:cytochrome c5